mgnify:CR=1 FL=1
MNQYIINAPHLQTLPKRLGCVGINLVCWAMWGYLIFPIITIFNWLRGDYEVINEMRWFGGYKSLLQLLEIYIVTLIILGLLWLFWIAMRKLRIRRFLIAAQHCVTDAELCGYYHVEEEKLLACRSLQNITIFFDSNGQITDMIASTSTHFDCSST